MKLSAFRMKSMPLAPWLRNVFNLNDSRWGRGDDKQEGQGPEGQAKPEAERPSPVAGPQSGGPKNTSQSGPLILMSFGGTSTGNWLACSAEARSLLEAMAVAFNLT